MLAMACLVCCSSSLRLLPPRHSVPVVRVVTDANAMSLSANASLTVQSIEAQISGLRYVDKSRVARDVLGLIRNSNSLLMKIQPFGTQHNTHAHTTRENTTTRGGQQTMKDERRECMLDPHCSLGLFVSALSLSSCVVSLFSPRERHL